MSDLDICNKCFKDNKNSCIESLGDPHHPDDIYKICREFKIIKLTKCVKFYAKESNWITKMLGVCDLIHEDDLEQLEDSNGIDWNIGGRLARQTLKDLKGERS